MGVIINDSGQNFNLYYNILDYWKTVMSNHPSIGSVQQGDLFDIDSKEFPAYPLGNILITNASMGERTTTWTCQLTVADKVKLKNNESSGSLNSQVIPYEGVYDVVDIHANTLAIINDLTSYTQRAVEAAEINGDISCVPFRDNFDNGLAGWVATFDMTVHNNKNICIFELLPTTTTTSGPTTTTTTVPPTVYTFTRQYWLSLVDSCTTTTFGGLTIYSTSSTLGVGSAVFTDESLTTPVTQGYVIYGSSMADGPWLVGANGVLSLRVCPTTTTTTVAPTTTTTTSGGTTTTTTSGPTTTTTTTKPTRNLYLGGYEDASTSNASNNNGEGFYIGWINNTIYTTTGCSTIAGQRGILSGSIPVQLTPGPSSYSDGYNTAGYNNNQAYTFGSASIADGSGGLYANPFYTISGSGTYDIGTMFLNVYVGACTPIQNQPL